MALSNLDRRADGQPGTDSPQRAVTEGVQPNAATQSNAAERLREDLSHNVLNMYTARFSA
jgi:hypothetical protein